MPAQRKEFAIMEWEFLRFDPAFRALSSDSVRLTYLSLWALCVHLRKDTFKPSELCEGYVPDMCGVTERIAVVDTEYRGSIAKVTCEWMGKFVEECVATGLLTRGPRGAIRVKGVKSKHDKLRGWNEGTIAVPIAAPLRPIIPLTGTGTGTGTGTVQGEDHSSPPEAGAATPSVHGQVITIFCDLYQKRRNEKYQFLAGKDGAAAARLAKLIQGDTKAYPDPPAEITLRAGRYFDSDFAKSKHCGLAAFCSWWGNGKNSGANLFNPGVPDEIKHRPVGMVLVNGKAVPASSLPENQR